MSRLTLRTYQQEAIDALYGYFSEHTGNPLVVLPTGAGKSLVIAEFVRTLFEAWPDQRVIMLTHVKELIEQNLEKILNVWPEAPVGVYSAGLGRRDTDHKIIFAGIQSVYMKSRKLGAFDLIIVDEAHLINHRSGGRYAHFLAEQREMNDRVKVIGLTATPFRTDHGDITKSRDKKDKREDTIFNAVAYDKPLLELIEEGYLSTLVPKNTEAKIDLTGVKVRGGEFVEKDLQAATDNEELTSAAAREILMYGQDRKSWLIFCTGVDHAYHVRDALRKCGVDTETITGHTPKTERARIIEDYRSGKIRALTNANVLTTGFDAPQTDLIAFLRATYSPGLYLQMAGRGTRLSPGKKNCLVLDFASNVLRHGPVDMITAWNPVKSRPQEAPTKTCPECKTILPIAVMTCPECGYQFEPDEDEKSKLEDQASDLPILSSQIVRPKPEYQTVTGVRYVKHIKKGGASPPSLRVMYICGLRMFSEWVCLEHSGFAQQKAHKWWSARINAYPPDTVDQALQLTDYLKTPARILVDESSKYPRIMKHDFKSKRESRPDHGDRDLAGTGQVRPASNAVRPVRPLQ